MAKITPRKKQENHEQITVKTQKDLSKGKQGYKWWLAGSKRELADEIISTAAFLKEMQQYRYRQAGIHSRMYGNLPISNFVGSNANRMNSSSGLPIDRPTMNVVQSCVDTLVSRITQSRPRPVFLTDNGNYKERNLAKTLNQFVGGELFNCRAYELGPLMLRDAAALGTGCIKLYEKDNRVAMERVMSTELLVDPNDSLYGSPRQLYQLKLADRGQVMDMFPDYKSVVKDAEQAFPDDSGESARTVSDQVMLVEGWHLPSGKDAKDGRHTIACTAGIVFDEPFEKQTFPFVFMHYSPRIMGFWGQGLSEQLMGTQIEINKLLMTISTSINLVGVPRVFVEDGSKVVKAHLNNQIGSIVTYRGTKPSYEVAPCIPQELYAQLERLVNYAYQQSGISALAATSQKPAGLNSGEAIRNYDDLQSDRFAALSKRYDDMFVALAYLITDYAKDIAEREGSYTTVYPNKDSTREVDLPSASILEDSYIIQCFDSSSLPRDPAGRLQKVTEMMQSGLVSLDEGRRLLDFPDIEQVDKLKNASEERILKILDEIVDKGKYTPPDPFMNLELANELVTQYYNLYSGAKLEESKAQLLRDFHTQIQDLKMAAMPPAMPPGMPGAPPAGGAPMAVPQAPPTSDVLPIAPQG